MEDWTMGIFKCKAQIGGGDPIEAHLGGWIKGYFAIAPRQYLLSDWDDETAIGWVITHLPTGYVTRTVKSSSRTEAMEIVEAINDLGDWSFTDANEATAFKEAVSQLAVKYPSISSQSDFLRALWLDHVS